MKALDKFRKHLNLQRMCFCQYVGEYVVCDECKLVKTTLTSFCGGHEIFLKIFDGPRNVFSYSIFMILFFELKGLKHKIYKLAIKKI